MVTPLEADHLYSERVMRLPHTVFCFASEMDYPLPDFVALAGRRPLTFGSFNNIPKLTPHTIRLEQQILTCEYTLPGIRDGGLLVVEGRPLSFLHFPNIAGKGLRMLTHELN